MQVSDKNRVPDEYYVEKPSVKLFIIHHRLTVNSLTLHSCEEACATKEHGTEKCGPSVPCRAAGTEN